MKTYTITVNGKAYAVTVEEGAAAGAAPVAAAPVATPCSSSCTSGSSRRRSRLRTGGSSHARQGSCSKERCWTGC